MYLTERLYPLGNTSTINLGLLLAFIACQHLGQKGGLATSFMLKNQQTAIDMTCLYPGLEKGVTCHGTSYLSICGTSPGCQRDLKESSELSTLLRHAKRVIYDGLRPKFQTRKKALQTNSWVESRRSLQSSTLPSLGLE